MKRNKKEGHVWVRVTWERYIGKKLGELEKRFEEKKQMQCVCEIWWACFMFGLSVAQSLPQSLAVPLLLITHLRHFLQLLKTPLFEFSFSLSRCYSHHIFSNISRHFIIKESPFLKQSLELNIYEGGTKNNNLSNVTLDSQVPTTTIYSLVINVNTRTMAWILVCFVF